MTSGTVLMTERRSRKGVMTTETLTDDSRKLSELADELICIVDSMRHSSIEAIEVDGVHKLQRGLELAYDYVSRVEAQVRIAIARETRH